MSCPKHRIDMSREANTSERHDIAVILAHIAKTHDAEVSIGLLDQLHPDKYRGDTNLAAECRAWLISTPKPTLAQILVMGFLLNKGLIFMTQSHGDEADDDVAWGSLIESKQLASMSTDNTNPDSQDATHTVPAMQTEPDAAHLGEHSETDLTAFEKELHDMALQ